MASLSEQLKIILEKEPDFRRAQIERAWFDANINNYDEITTLPKNLREQLEHFPWLTLELHAAFESKIDNTRKFLFKLRDGNFIETVAMGRKNLKKDAKKDATDRYTICISSQVGCPMRCVFCATGKAGFKRNLAAEEIIDQVRFCQRVLAKEGARINNIVVMGQGEPLLNYENVKRALRILLKNAGLGETKITVSTAGVPAVMEKLLTDADFPSVRWAVSLHSAIEETRKKIMPSHKNGFLDFLVRWANEYNKRFSSRAHFIGLEYIFLQGINDDDKHLRALLALCRRIKHIRVNLIPFNSNGEGTTLSRSSGPTIDHWHEELMKAGLTSTIRYSQGQDIAAACGQLANKICTAYKNSAILAP